ISRLLNRVSIACRAALTDTDRSSEFARQFGAGRPGELQKAIAIFSNQGINWSIARDTCISGPSRCAVLIIEIMTVARARFGRTESSGVRKGCEAMLSQAPSRVRLRRPGGIVWATRGRGRTAPGRID